MSSSVAAAKKENALEAKELKFLKMIGFDLSNGFTSDDVRFQSSQFLNEWYHVFQGCDLIKTQAQVKNVPNSQVKICDISESIELIKFGYEETGVDILGTDESILHSFRLSHNVCLIRGPEVPGTQEYSFQVMRKTEWQEEREMDSFRMQQYFASVKKLVLALDPGQSITFQDVEICYQQKMATIEAAEYYFQHNKFDISKLQPLKGETENFYTERSKHVRPFITIFGDDYKKVFYGKPDYYLTPTGQVIAVNSEASDDNKVILFPYIGSEAQKILDLQ